VVAITNNHIELTLFLLEKGADPNAFDNFYRRTPLFAAVEMRDRDFTRDTAPPVEDARDPVDLIKALLARGPTRTYEPTPLPSAVSCKFPRAG